VVVVVVVVVEGDELVDISKCFGEGLLCDSKVVGVAELV